MSFDNNQPNDQWFNSPAANPDNGSHLEKIRHEVSNPPPEPRFFGLNLGIVKLGFTDDGAFNPGVNLGIVHAEAKVGAVNGAEAGVNLGPIVDAHAGGFVGVDRNGFKGHVGAGAHALTLVGGDGEVNTRLGNATGVSVGGDSYVGPLGSRAGAGVALGQDGLDAAVGGAARAGRLAGVHGGAHLGLNSDSQVNAGAGGNLGDVGVGTAAGVWSDGNSTARADVYAKGHAGYNRGAIDVNPPAYGDAPPQPYYRGQQSPLQEQYSEQSRDQARGQTEPLCPPGHGTGRSARIESHPLPVLYEKATPENEARFEHEMSAQLADKYTYTVQKGDTYDKIAAKLLPGETSDQLKQEAQMLKQMHDDNGYHGLHAGQKIETLNPYALNYMVRKAEAKHFGWLAPES